MSELTERPFDFSRISPEAKEKLEAIQKSASEIERKDLDELIGFSIKQIEILEHEKALQKKKYPANPPNNSCHNALLTGLLFSNEIGLRLHDFIPYFSTDYEKAYIWTHTRNHSSSLIVDVDSSVKSLNVWRNLASILELTVAISFSFENIVECDYDWIYNFLPETSIKDTEFLYLENFDRFSGSGHRISFFADHASLIELLCRDERFYVMGMNLLTSFINHQFCLICAFKKDGYQEHPNHELPSWQVAQAIPKMEVAIVQATRAVEAVLGKPGKRDDNSKYQRALDRWKEAIDLEPTDNFGVANKSYIDYYYELFGIRGEAAHSLGSFPYELCRLLTIESQCFAWEILKSYFHRHSLSTADARLALNFNMNFIEREPKNWSTTMTADSDKYPNEIA